MLKKTIKRYYDLAYDYYLSAEILWKQIHRVPFIYNPAVYLLRHSIELSLKGLIIQGTIKTSPKISVNDLKIKENNMDRNINSVHSLYYLWENLKQLNQNIQWMFAITKEQERVINKVIKSFNDKDFNSTMFRYPYDKQGKPIIIEPLDLDNSGLAPDLSQIPPVIMQHGDEILVVKKGVKSICQAQDLFGVTEFLFKCYER